MKRVLFISYDGLTDPLGQSQILPYVLGLQKMGMQFSILSFEKPDRLRSGGPEIQTLLKEHGIRWHPLRFHRKPKLLAKAWDLFQLYTTAIRVCLTDRIQVTHCRGYVPAQVGLLLKLWLGVKLIFDMRGLWADERLDGGIWTTHKPVDKLLYQYYRGLERRLLQNSDQVITLTERSLEILAARCSLEQLRPHVIPCCADYDHFRLGSAESRARGRQLIGIHEAGPVLGYLGSLGTWYMFEEMVQFFAALCEELPQVCFVIVTLDWSDHFEKLWQQLGMNHLRSRLFICRGSRAQVPDLISAFDLSVSFIRPAFSKLASSPTKIAETLAVGVPVVCNDEIGDIERQIENLGAGIVVREFSPEAYKEAAKKCAKLLSLSPLKIRDGSRDLFDLQRALDSYGEVYRALDSGS